MKKIFTKGVYLIGLFVLLVSALPSWAQQVFTKANVETGRLYTALAKDVSGNIYVTRLSTDVPNTYEVVKYTGGAGTPVRIYSGLTHQTSNFPWGLAVSPVNNDVY